MRASLHHRGPDASSIHHHKSQNFQVFFAANRLKINDKSDLANQPFFPGDNQSILLFNGEIYNFFDLKNELLRRGATFTTHSDTEVLLHWLKMYGETGLSQLNGMFSFLYYDFQKDELIAARDAFGMKPLYYYQDDRYFIISSEIKGIFSTGLVEKELNSEQIPHYLALRYGNPSKTFYRKIFPLQKGSYLKLKSPDFSPEFKDIGFNNEKNPSADIEVYKEKIKEGLLKQLYADCEVGLLLSGGIDSSLLLLLANEEGFQIPSFSVFAPENQSEKKLAEGLTRKLRTEHHQLAVDETILEDFEEYISFLDQPIADSAGLLTYKICQYASPRAKVLLSGAGADELFAGYNRHEAYYFYLKHRKNLLTAKKYLWPLIKPIAGTKSRNLGTFFSNLHENRQTTFYYFISSHFKNLRRGFSFPEHPDDPGRDYFTWALAHDRNNYLPNDILQISDIMSMRAGVEMRTPYLDNDLWQLVNHTGSGFFIARGRKWILQEILKDYVPASFLKQKKQGFGLPLQSWLRSPSRAHLWELFQDKNSLIFNFIDRNFFCDLLHTHQNKKGNYEQELWSILTLAYWLKKEFE